MKCLILVNQCSSNSSAPVSLLSPYAIIFPMIPWVWLILYILLSKLNLWCSQVEERRSELDRGGLKDQRARWFGLEVVLLFSITHQGLKASKPSPYCQQPHSHQLLIGLHPHTNTTTKPRINTLSNIYLLYIQTTFQAALLLNPGRTLKTERVKEHHTNTPLMALLITDKTEFTC